LRLEDSSGISVPDTTMQGAYDAMKKGS
jgi:hypothetical protein